MVKLPSASIQEWSVSLPDSLGQEGRSGRAWHHVKEASMELLAKPPSSLWALIKSWGAGGGKAALVKLASMSPAGSRFSFKG